jgi:ribosomal protein S18 acetylase RimI-like enzyme
MPGMAAATEARSPAVVALRDVRVAELDPLLEEETAEWLSRLSWDFRPSADLVRRFTGVRSLAGCAIRCAGKIAGYSYLVSEGCKGLIGDLYIRAPYRTPANETLLMSAALDELFGRMGVTRIEAQLMMLGAWPGLPLPRREWLRIYPRHFMAIPLDGVAGMRPGRAARQALIEGWDARRTDEAAQVIALAYRGHVDSDVNDQYRSAAGARRFLHNIIQYGGCGTFFAPASFVAVDVWTGRACGCSFASMISRGVGHITQICVAPPLKGRGLGYELMRRSLLALAEAGCRRASLTVTAANSEAVSLYERVGFRTIHNFQALVWERGEAPPAA